MEPANLLVLNSRVCAAARDVSILSVQTEIDYCPVPIRMRISVLAAVSSGRGVDPKCAMDNYADAFRTSRDVTVGDVTG